MSTVEVELTSVPVALLQEMWPASTCAQVQQSVHRGPSLVCFPYYPLALGMHWMQSGYLEQLLSCFLSYLTDNLRGEQSKPIKSHDMISSHIKEHHRLTPAFGSQTLGCQWKLPKDSPGKDCQPEGWIRIHHKRILGIKMPLWYTRRLWVILRGCHCGISGGSNGSHVRSILQEFRLRSTAPPPFSVGRKNLRVKKEDTIICVALHEAVASVQFILSTNVYTPAHKSWHPPPTLIWLRHVSH